MENRVNDKGLTRVTFTLIAVIFVPFAFIATSLLRSHDEELVAALGVALALTVLIALSMQVATNAWIRISIGDGKISRFNKLFGYTVFKKDYDLRQFDRISLHRGFRGGYYASLVGREQEVIIARSMSLGRLREVAEQAAAVASVKINDQL
jgi:hypothetical protein